ncbi:MAG: hypothetical protein QM530_03695 [Phycisphaerales bacterium]|nr:hypothetical protein [Phycisphaerales bacterium]
MKKHTLIFYSIFIFFFVLSCNNENTSVENKNEESKSSSIFSNESDDETLIKELISNWTKLDPAIIGGPWELKDFNAIKNIEISNISKNNLSTTANLTFETKNGTETKIEYSLVFDKSKWAILEINHHSCFPPISIDVIEGRKKLNIRSTNENLTSNNEKLEEEVNNPQSENNSNVLSNQIIEENNSYKNYQVKTDKAYFYNYADFSEKRKAYLVKHEKIKAIKTENEFVYVEFTNANGKETSGWISKDDIEEE